MLRLPALWYFDIPVICAPPLPPPRFRRVKFVLIRRVLYIWTNSCCSSCSLLVEIFVKWDYCWSLRCSWSIACRRCSNYIFILDLTYDFSILHKDNCTTRRQRFKFWDLVHLTLESWEQLTFVSFVIPVVECPQSEQSQLNVAALVGGMLLAGGRRGVLRQSWVLQVLQSMSRQEQSQIPKWRQFGKGFNKKDAWKLW